MDVTGGKNLSAETEKVSSTVQVSIMEPTVLRVSYEVQSLATYYNEWSRIRLPDASSTCPVIATLSQKNTGAISTYSINCGESNSHWGTEFYGLWWDSSNKILYVAGINETNTISFTQEGHETTTIDYNLRRPVLGPNMNESSGNASITFEDGIAHVVLDDSGSDSFIRISPYDPVTGLLINESVFATPVFINTNIYYPFEEGCIDYAEDNTGNPTRFNYSLISGDEHAFDFGNIRVAGEIACAESEGYSVELMHTELSFSDCLMKITVNPYTVNKNLGTFHNTQVSTGQDTGCSIRIYIPNNNYEIKRYVYVNNDAHAEANEANWTSDRMQSAEASMSISNGRLYLNPIGNTQNRYPCGTYLVRTSIVNPYNNETRYGYYMFDLILDINIIPNFLFIFDDKTFTERVGYFDYRHDVAGYRIGLTYHCPLAKKGSTFVEDMAPTVVAQFEYEDTYGATGPQLIKGYEGLFESDYNGPVGRSMTFSKDISWSGTVDSENDYWKTNYWLTNRGSEYIFTNIFEMNEGGWHAGYNEFNWFFNNKNDSSTTLDVLLGNANWSKSQDSGFYHIGKVTDTIIEMTYEDGWLHY